MAFVFSKIKLSKLIRLFTPVIIVGAFLFLINIFVLRDHMGETYKVYFNGTITITQGSIYRTLAIMMRIYSMIIITTVLTTTTKPIDITRGIEDLLLPLKLIRFPVHIVAMIISIALRFIPTLLEEAQRIMKAQASRGVDFKNGGPKSKIKSTITLIIPLFVTAFAKAEDLGNAMETRGYDPYLKRTHYRQYKIKLIDIFILLLVLSLLAISILIMVDVIIPPQYFIAYQLS
jgi:energy-coupling factor transport system permease protein